MSQQKTYNIEGAGSLRIISYNCGLLRMKVFGTDVMSNPPFVIDRFPCLSKALLDSDADIIALQEIYESGHVKSLLKDVEEKYPYSARMNSSYFWQFHNALLFLSKYPILKSETIKHKQSAFVESCLASKSMQTVEVDTPMGAMLFVNMHTTAGGFSPESKAADNVRKSELDEAMRACKDYNEGTCVSILLGDMNMGPEASKVNYEHVLNEGFTDEVIGELEKVEGETGTWSPENILNKTGPHGHCPAQRCDHLFLEKKSPLTVTSARLFMKEPFVESKAAGQKITLSDHYGLDIVVALK